MHPNSYLSSYEHKLVLGVCYGVYSDGCKPGLDLVFGHGKLMQGLLSRSCPPWHADGLQSEHSSGSGAGRCVQAGTRTAVMGCHVEPVPVALRLNPLRGPLQHQSDS